MNKFVSTFLKGLAMGAADVVPGVSGGTIAFITGIYDLLLDSINSINFGLVNVFKSEGIKGVWKTVNGNFLLPLFIGIGTSIFSLARLIKYFLAEHPTTLWAFFFGLIIASILYLKKEVTSFNIKSLFSIIIGASFVVAISIMPVQTEASNLIYLFFCGAIAASAMILPGISGSFILLLLGAYTTAMSAIADKNIVIISVLGSGVVAGLLSFSKFLNWILKNYRNTTFSVLIGFLIGSLYKIWPWKHVEQIFVKHVGEPKESVINVVETNVLPSNYDVFIRKGTEISGYLTEDPKVILAILFCIIGFSLIFVIESLGKRKGKTD